MSFVSLNIEYFPDPTRGVPVYKGYVYIGEPDTDPEIPGNQVPVTLRLSDGSTVVAIQPIRTGAGGVALHNGSPVQLLVDQNYAIKVLDKHQSEVYYVANATGVLVNDPLFGSGFLLADLKSLGLLSNGDVVVTSGRDSYDDNAGGVWVFNSSNLSAEVSADVASGVYAPPNSDPTGASGAWVRQWTTLYSRYFGLDKTGTTDVTDEIASMYTIPSEGLRVIEFEDGQYSINPFKGGLRTLLVQSNTKITFSKDAWMVAVDCGSTISTIMETVGVEHVTIINPQLIGDAVLNGLPGEGAGHGLSFRSCSNIIVEGGDISACFTDGIYINDVSNSVFSGFNTKDNGRQGLSVISGENIYIHNFTASGSYKNAPMAGVDIEPNSADTLLKNVVVENFETFGNTGAGLTVNIHGTDLDLDLVIRNHCDTGSATGAAFTSAGDTATLKKGGSVLYENSVLLDSVNSGLSILWRYLTGAKLTIVRPHVHNCNTSGGTNQRVNDVGICIHTDSTVWLAGDPLGNVTVIEPKVTMPLGASVSRGIYFGYTVPFYNIRIVNPLEIQIADNQDDLLSTNIKMLVGKSGIAVEGNVVLDDYGALVIKHPASICRSYGGSVQSRIIDVSTTGPKSFNEFAAMDIIEEMFIETGSRSATYTVLLDAGAGTLVSGGSTVVGEYYKITTQATLDFTTVGAPNNSIGTYFTCTAVDTLGAGDELVWRPFSYVDSAGVSVSSTAVTSSPFAVLKFEKIAKNYFKVLSEVGAWVIT